MSFLLLTVRFLDDRYHGLVADAGPPEWPPSPFRLFCALVAGLARRGALEGDAGKALTCLQTLDPPIIIAPKAKKGQAIRRYVPNNDGDKWPDRQDRLGTKPTIPTLFLLAPNRNPEVHYVWHIGETSDVPFDHIRTAARSLTALGWGIDMAFADARLVNKEEIQRLSGIRWHPTRAEGRQAGIMLRVPTADDKLQECTLSDLKHCHETVMQRIGAGEPLHTVHEPRVFERVFYTAGPPPRPLPIAFEIHRTIEHQERPEYAGKSKFRPFHHVRRVATVAGMVRNATAAVARRLGWDPADIASRILGHGGGDNGQATSDDRLLFLPLPSITPNGISGIRRVLLVGPPGFDLAPLRRRLNGEELINEDSKRSVAMLSGIAATDRNVAPFLAPATTWSTVTPVILPGYDDPDKRQRLARLHARTLALIWKAFHQAGWTEDALVGAKVEYRAIGWFRGLDLARHYELPPLRFPRYHVRVQFVQPVVGPLVIGAGRYRGVGLFAREQ
jgi:CRISPR-associated protein Csb2